MLRTALWAAFDQSCLLQHRHPVAFFQALEKQGVWRLLWPARLLIILCGLFVLPALLFAFSGERWVILATTMAACVFLMVSGFFMILASPIAGSQPLRWVAYLFLYHFSAPLLVVVLLCAAAPLTSVGLWLGWYVGLPMLLGVSLADACALAVDQCAHQTRAHWVDQRQGGPAAELPELRLWQRADAVRAGVVVLLVGGAGVMAWLYGAAGSIAAVLLLSAAVGCARLEATLLACCGWPLVKYAHRQNRWRATYVGRTALWVGTPAVVRSLSATLSAQATSAVVLALLQEGGLCGAVRQAWGRLPETTLPAILLQLSLTDGGADVLRFLQPQLSSPALRDLAQLYARLATEAAKPLDLHRWIALLPPPPVANETVLPNSVAQLLSHVRQALLAYKQQPLVTQAKAELHLFIHSLAAEPPDRAHNPAPPARLSWPFALSVHLAHHCQQLDETSRSTIQPDARASL